MEIQEIELKDIVIEYRGAKFTFHPASYQDVVYAGNLLISTQMKVVPVRQEECIAHVFGKLKALEGVKLKGEELDIKTFQGKALTFKASDITPILNAWAVEVSNQHGFLDAEEREKKDLASA